jgi:hypothetical protein
VTVAAVLLAYAADAGTLGARMLGRARLPARAPLLAIITYLAAAWSVVAAAGLAGLTLAVHATALGGALSQLIGACVLRLRDAYATPGGATAAGLGLTLAAAVAARAVVTAVTHLRAVRQILPFLPLMRDADTQITRLVEMHADDAATADRDTRPLATALVVLAAAGPTPGLAAAATDAVQRIQRLLRPAEPLSRARRQLLRAGAAALALTPGAARADPGHRALALGRVPAA